MNCKNCNREVTPLVELKMTGPHEAALRCPACGWFLGWKAKDKNQARLDKRPNNCPTPDDLGINWCQICLRKREWLGKNETLETHHIDDDPTNNQRLNHLVACTMCHKFVAWVRLYVNQHLAGFYNGSKNQTYEEMKKRLSAMALSPDEYNRQILLIAQLLEI